MTGLHTLAARALWSTSGISHGLVARRKMVEAIGLVRPELGARLRLGGRISEPGLEAELRALPGWRHVDYLGWLDRSAVRSVLGEARVGLVTLQPVRNYSDGQPVKLFEYMAAGVPVVASDFSQWRRFVDDAGTGVMVDPADPAAIAASDRAPA